MVELVMADEVKGVRRAKSKVDDEAVRLSVG